MNVFKKYMMTTLVLTSLALPVGATTVNTVAGGTMNLPAGLTMTAASHSQTLASMQDFLENIVNDKNSKTYAVNSAKSQLTELGKVGPTYDLYQLHGADKTGQKTALVAAVDMSEIVKNMKADSSMTPAAVTAFDLLENNHYQLDPLTEQVMLATINSQLPSLENSINASLNKNRAGQVERPYRTSVTLEGMTKVHRLANSHLPIYTMSTRALIDTNGFQLPYYVEAYVVTKKDKPTAYLVLTSDVERTYFQPALQAMFQSLQ